MKNRLAMLAITLTSTSPTAGLFPMPDFPGLYAEKGITIIRSFNNDILYKVGLQYGA